ncbi:SxtJ family membrane protein [Bradyrhizobium sp.]|uniref:SxtJ family membrane protein n=1 Tax=Bradyrhizobium sp. TaxID=376 RepID=UPI0023A3BAFE|nr:SxtJ family membrane protein [Bradyrhizobium sp.]MDE2376607.1 hypothetical protein [Bradyrhizobium sp.]
MPGGALHEDLRREDETSGPSDRKFGLTIGAVLAVIAALKAFHLSPWALFWGALAAVFVILALARPALLSLPNRLWLKLGLLLHRLVNPVIMAILFYGTILPVGLLMRAFGKDPLRLRLEKNSESYWLPRSDDRPQTTSMRQQF